MKLLKQWRSTMKLWCVLNTSATQKICEVLAFYARCHSSRKPIAKKFPILTGRKYKNVNVETARYCLELHHEPDTPAWESLWTRRRKQFHKVARLGPTEADREGGVAAISQHALKCFARYAPIV
jgi:hypothetical protein